MFSHINIITIIIICMFSIPVLTGIVYPVSKIRIQQSALSAADCLKYILGLILTFYLVRIIFSGTENGFTSALVHYIPSSTDLISQYQQDIVAWAIFFFILLCVILFLLNLLALPFKRHVLVPLSDKFYSIMNKMHAKQKRIIGGLWQLPKSVCMVVVFSLLLNFYTSFINNPSAGDYINASRAYQIIHKNMLRPILNADLIKSLPILIGDVFKKAAEDYTPANSDNSGEPNYWKLPAIKYFNGMTIDEAVQSNSDIDDTAKQIVGTEENENKKAYLLYQWVSKNIRYDKVKAEIVLKNPSRVNSGSIITFEIRTGVCFDYSCLYVSMCRAVGLKVRLVSGLGYSGEEWGEHVWNQVYDPEEEKWVNVDTTFGNSGNNYFDNSGFSANHKYDVVQAEW